MEATAKKNKKDKKRKLNDWNHCPSCDEIPENAHQCQCGQKLKNISPWFKTEVTRTRLSGFSGREHIATEKDASFKSMSLGATIPGDSYVLSIVTDFDEESGGPFDVDGDRSCQYLQMYSAQTRVLGGDLVVVTGFVLERDRETREDNFHIEEWVMCKR